MSIKKIELYKNITIHNLSLILNVEHTKIIKICSVLGIIATTNYILNKELIQLILDEFGYKAKFIKNKINLLKNNIKIDNNIVKKINRPPIVTILGHVDHGKTSLLDYIRNKDTISKEYGNITQHISIFNIKFKNNKSITFIDTPGHESFISIRNRGLKITDIVIIVIASDSGIMKQTLESINNAKSENLPIIFVFTKIDKKESNINKIKEDLSKINILVEDWGGEYITQDVSVKTGYGIDLLIKKILKISNKINLLTNLNILSSGTIIESSLDKSKGYIVKLLVKEGILKIGDYIIAGIYYGKIKKIFYDNKIYKYVYPSIPAYVIGFNGAPLSGDKFNVLNDYKEVKLIYNERKYIIKNNNKLLFKNNIDNINLIIKADVYGSIDVISEEIEKISLGNKNIQFNIIKKSVGNITISDILLANTSNSIILGFNIKIDINKKKYNKPIKNIYIFNIIYDIIDYLKNIIKKKNKKKIEIIGDARVIQEFNIKNKKIFGCIVLNGKINKNYKIKIIRSGITIYKGNILSIKRFNKNLIEVKKGYDFGIIINKFKNLKINDIITCYNI